MKPTHAKSTLHDDNEQYNKLTIYKDKGELRYAKSYTLKLISTAEKLVCQHTSMCCKRNNYDVLNLIRGLRINFYNMQKDTKDGSNNHYFTLVSSILECYLQTWQNHISKRSIVRFIFLNIQSYTCMCMSIWAYGTRFSGWFWISISWNLHSCYMIVDFILVYIALFCLAACPLGQHNFASPEFTGPFLHLSSIFKWEMKPAPS